MPLQGKRLAFIGGGTMAEAMIRGVLDKHLCPRHMSSSRVHVASDARS